MNTTSAQGVAIDRGVGGITVRAFGAGGAYLSGTTTAANGTYTLDVTAALPFTGSDSAVLIVLGVALLAVGAALVSLRGRAGIRR